MASKGIEVKVPTGNVEVTVENKAETAALTVVEEAATLPAAESAAQPENPNIVKLSHPYDWDGKMVDSIDVDLTKVSGRDMKTISRTLESTGEINPMAVMPEFSIPYILQLVAYAARIPVDFLENLDWPDVMKLKVKVISFFGA